MSIKEEKKKDGYLAGNIRLLRKMKRLSQQKLADQLGLKRNNIATYEAGIVEPSAVNFLKIAGFFQVPPKYLFFTDLSQFPQFQMERQEDRTEEKRKQDIELFKQVVHQNHEVQTILEGFKAFYQLKEGQEAAAAGDEDASLKVDLVNALIALEELLDANWNFIHAIQKDD
jgi:transcriptional regulator with XRE-family HTH domain